MAENQKDVKEIFGKYHDRARKIHDKIKGNPPKPAYVELPFGIPKAVAKLVDAKIGVYQSGALAGENYFMLKGQVVSPEEHNGERIKGLFTTIMEPLCDTDRGKRQSFEDHYDFMLEELKKLDIGDRVEGIDYSDIPDLLEVMLTEDIYFEFRTSNKNPNYQATKPYHNWIRLVEFKEDVEEDPAPKKSSVKHVEKHVEEEVEEVEEVEDAEEVEEEQVEETTISEDDVVNYKPPGKNRKPVLCRVTEVYDGKCDLVEIKSRAAHSLVPIEELLPID